MIHHVIQLEQLPNHLYAKQNLADRTRLLGAISDSEMGNACLVKHDKINVVGDETPLSGPKEIKLLTVIHSQQPLLGSRRDVHSKAT